MPLNRPAACAIGALLFVPSVVFVPLYGQCQGWLPGEGVPATSGTFRAATMFDADGPGPVASELLVGGTFSNLGGMFQQNNHLARWDGLAWRSFPLPLTGASGMNALAVFDLDADGPNPPRLIVGGGFDLGIPPNRVTNIFAWGGGSFIRMSDGLNGAVNALHVFDADGDGPGGPELYAGGAFRMSGGRSMNAVARWDGSLWQPVGFNLSGTVHALTSIDLDGDGPMPAMLAASGDFNLTTGGGRVAFFNGAGWLTFNSYPQGSVTSLAVFDFDGPGGDPARLVAAGSFLNSNTGVRLNGQAYFDATVWRPIAPVSSGSGRTVGVFDEDGSGPGAPRLFLSGNFLLPGSFVSLYLLEYVDGAWVGRTSGQHGGEVLSMQTLVLPGHSEPSFFMTGTLVRIAPPSQPLRLCTLEDAGLSPFMNGFDNLLRDMTVADLNGVPTLVACGSFLRAPGVSANGVAAFDGESWSTLGSSPSGGGSSEAVIAFDPDDDGPEPEMIILGGTFEEIGGVSALHVAMFDGKNWSAMGGGIPSFPRGFASFDPDGAGPLPNRLYASGGLLAGGPGTPGYIYEWNGREWGPRPQQFVSNVGPPQTLEMTTFDPDGAGPEPRVLVIVGSFNRVGSVTANNIASFDGQTWRPLGSGFNTNPQALFAWDRNNDGNEVIVVGGLFTSAGGVQARGAAVWDGERWEAIGNGFGTSSGFQAHPDDFCVFDGSLYATGSFSIANGGPADGIARWNSEAWVGVGAGLGGGGLCLDVLPAHEGRSDVLCVGGIFSSAGGAASAYFAQYSDVGCCPADYDEDGIVNSQDFFAFLEDFLNGDDAADFNDDGSLNSADFFDFLRSFFEGC